MSEPGPFPPTAPPPRRVEPGLYLVATPIGNLRDMTLRALDVLAAADLVLAEDTRVTAKLLTAYGLKAKLERCDDHASTRAAELAIERLRNGEVVALVSDAGTPLVSDPGFVVARAVIAEGLPVHPIPGPSSLLAALCIAGLGPRPAAVARELTKLFEECVRGPLDELAVHPKLDGPKGEIVVVVGPGEAEVASAADADAALAEALTRLAPGEAASEVSRALDLPRKPLYRRALELQGK
ncbi:MAG: 16S rRNA (cytidine(1402)-2'-O)-methyltransferase [Brevundimonas mediterranea]